MSFIKVSGFSCCGSEFLTPETFCDQPPVTSDQQPASRDK